MTGALLIKGRKPHHYVDFTVDSVNWPPRFWKWILEFDNGKVLAFTDPRRFSRTRLVENPLHSPPISELGFDPIEAMPSLANFIARIGKRSVPVKSLLLDQSFAAGIGNWTADEILYQAKIHPMKKTDKLNPHELEQLHHHILHLLKQACALNADSDRFPKEWLFHYRWEKGSKVKPTMPNGDRIIYETVGGRTTAIVPAVQKMGGVGGGRMDNDEVDQNEEIIKQEVHKKNNFSKVKQAVTSKMVNSGGGDGSSTATNKRRLARQEEASGIPPPSRITRSSTRNTKKLK